METTEKPFSSESNESVSTKLFIGYLISQEVRMHLNNSSIWKEIQAFPKENTHHLREVHHNNKSFIGAFLFSKTPSLEELKKTQSFVSSNLQSYCEKLNVESLKITIFPQIFLS